MADIATLSIGIDASSAIPASKAMDQATASAGRLESATNRLNSTQSRMSQEMRRIGQEIRTAGGWDQWTAQMDRAGVSAGLAQQRMHALGHQARLTGRDMAFMGFQFQDILVTAAMGMNPMMIALQQGTQLIQVFELRGIKLGQALRQVFSGVAQYFTSPLMLAVLAVGALGLAIQQLYQTWSGDGRTIADILKDQETAIQNLEKAYDGAAEGASRYRQAAQALAEGANAQALVDTQAARARIEEQLQLQMRAAVTPQMGLNPQDAVGVSGDALKLFQEFQNGTRTMQDVIAHLNGVRDRMKEIDPVGAMVVEGLIKQAQEWVNLSQAIEKADGSLSAAEATLKRVADAVKVMEGFTAGPDLLPEDQIEAATRTRIAEARTMGEVNAALADREKALRNLADAEANADQANQAAIAGIQARTAAERIAAEIAQKRIEFQSLDSEGGAAVTAREESELARQALRLRAEEEAKVAAAQRDRISAMDASIRAQQLEVFLFNETVEAAARARAQYELLEAAKKASEGGIISEEELAAIKATAEEIGRIAGQLDALEKAKQAKEAFTDIVSGGREAIAEAQLEAATIGMTEEAARGLRNEFDLLNQARAAGIVLSPQEIQTLQSLAQEMTAAEVAAIRLQDSYDFTRDVFDSFTGTMTASLRQGESLWDSFADGVVSALGRIADKLMEMATDQLLQAIFPTIAGSTGSSASGGGIIGMLLKGIPSLGTASRTSAPDFTMTEAASTAASAAASAATTAATKAATSVTGDILEASRLSIGNLESGMNYGALGPWTGGDRAYGAYQVMGNNVGPWTQKHLGSAMTPNQFLQNPGAQDAVFRGQFGGYIDKFGVGGAGQAWFGGPGSIGKGGRTDVLGTSVSKYQQMYEAGLEKFGKATEEAADSVGQLGQTSQTAMSQVGSASEDAWAGMRKVTAATETASSGLSQFGNNLANAMSSAGGGGGGGIFSGILGGLSSVFGGGLGGSSYMGSGFMPWAVAGNISPRWNAVGDVFDQATMQGLGEAGPEAIVPLGRDAAGRLGIKNIGGGGGKSARGSMALTVKVQGARGNKEIEEMVAKGVRAGLSEYNEDVLPTRVFQLNGDTRLR